LFFCCNNSNSAIEIGNYKFDISDTSSSTARVEPGACNINQILEHVLGSKVGIVANQTSTIGNSHIVDTLLQLNQSIIKVFSPEHGFRGVGDAGQRVDDEKDPKTGLPVISLYGKNKKPTDEQLKEIDIMIFDLQDVGTRFYTYISTLHYVMEACAENNIRLLLLDRPNPNAHYVDGPVLDTAKYRSFIGMHPVPVVYGMTIGEYAQMINGEKWLPGGVVCSLSVVKCNNYNHSKKYSLPVSPSPNLPNDRSVELYPSLCFFEGTSLSVGRGTDKQFQVVGHPLLEGAEGAEFSFTPRPGKGASNPVLNGVLCYGFDLSDGNSIFDFNDRLNIGMLQKVYELFPDKSQFFVKTNFFELLAGTSELRQQIINKVSENDIRAGWEQGLAAFIKIREKYLLYE
jgi:uncharacterized protein YbbC (DUF1343 family)